MGDVQGGWPFWAPSDDGLVDAALELAALKPGERFVDLGCGDGKVLVAAAEAGAHVTGIELDRELAEQARQALAEAGHDGEVLEADFTEVEVDADVVFTYLAPGTLQQLRPAFAALPEGTRLVTTGYPVVGWEPTDEDPTYNAWLYAVPPTAEQPGGRTGWPGSAAVAAAVADHTSLLWFRFQHPGGLVSVDVTGDLAGLVDLNVGCTEAAAGEAVAVDLRLADRPQGDVVTGGLAGARMKDVPLHVVWSHTESGLWWLDRRGARRVAALAAAEPVDGAGLCELAQALAVEG